MTLPPASLRTFLIPTLALISIFAGTSASIVAAQPPASQASPATSASLQERLNRVGASLSSGAPRVDAAIQELKAILAIDPRSADAHLFLGMAYRILGSADLMGEARAELVQALELNPSLVAARFILAQLYLDIRRPTGAKETLTTGLVQHPGQPQLLALLAEAERQLGDPRTSVDLARRALQGDPALLQARYYLGLALLDLGQRAEGIAELEQVVRADAPAAEAHLALGTAYLDAGRSAAALAPLQRAATIDPSRVETRLALSRAYRINGRLDLAARQLALARPGALAASASSASRDDLEPAYYLELGLVALKRGRLTAAADAFGTVLGLEPAHEEATRRLADIRKTRGAGAVRKTEPPR